LVVSARFDGKHWPPHRVGHCWSTRSTTPLFNKETDWGGYVLDSKVYCLAVRGVGGRGRHPGHNEVHPRSCLAHRHPDTPLERLYDTVLECFDRSSGRPVVIPKLKNKAISRRQSSPPLAISAQVHRRRNLTGLCSNLSRDGTQFLDTSVTRDTRTWNPLSASSIASSVTPSRFTGRPFP